MTEKQLEWEKFKPLIHESWHSDLKPFIESKECWDIYQFLKQQPKNSVIPKSNLLWRPFMECPKDKLKIIFTGLAPYHTRLKNKDYADGLCFSTQLEENPPSLQLLLDAVEDDCGLSGKRVSDLTFWANQGILMLNAGLSTTYLKAGNHVDLWYPFHKYMYENVYSKINGITFVYFGKEASKLAKLETPFIHYSKIVEHPARAARESRAFNHENLFTYCNKILEQNNGVEYTINWFEYFDDLPF